MHHQNWFEIMSNPYKAYYVATSFVVANRTVVENKETFSTNQVDDPLGLVSVAGFEVAMRSPMSYGLKIRGFGALHM